MALFKRKKDETGEEMSFIDHLEALRWHILRSVSSSISRTIAIFIYAA